MSFVGPLVCGARGLKNRDGVWPNLYGGCIVIGYALAVIENPGPASYYKVGIGQRSPGKANTRCKSVNRRVELRGELMFALENAPHGRSRVQRRVEVGRYHKAGQRPRGLRTPQRPSLCNGDVDRLDKVRPHI